MNQEKQSLDHLINLRGLFATDNPPQRYDHICKRCEEPFTNVVKDCDYCCVCEIRVQREEEWD